MNNDLWLYIPDRKEAVPQYDNLLSCELKNFKFYLKESKNLYYVNDDFLVFFKGNIYHGNNTVNFIYEEFKKKGISFVKELNGRFVLILIDKIKEKIFLVTDRLNYYKLFIQQSEEFILITENIFSQVVNNVIPDKFAISQFLTSGFVYSSDTLIKGISFSKPAHIYSIANHQIEKDTYWKPRFTNELSDKQENDLIEELYSLLKKVIKKRIKEDNFISLSGGYDATSLQLLINETATKKPFCYTYYSGKKNIYSDVWVAQKQSEILNNNLTLIESFNGNFEEFIRKNSIYGQGISNVSFEIDVWSDIINKSPLFVGEEFFGMRDLNALNVKDLFLSQNFNSWSVIKDSHIFFSQKLIDSTSESFTVFFNEIEKDIYNNETSFFDFQMLLYIKYHLPNVHMNWRRYFTGRENDVEMPLLDNEVIAFIEKLPYWARTNKYLFKKTLKVKYCNFFKNINRAKSSNNYDWEKIIQDNKELILKMNDEQSILDQFIKPDAVEDLLSDTTINNNVFIKKAINSIIIRLKFPRIFRLKTYLPGYLIVLRILVLKYFFIEFEKRNKIINE